MPGDPASVRLDVWLWAVRLTKTRSAATAQCRGGHVRLNGAPVKAAQAVRVGDEVRLRKPGVEHIYRVRRIIARRVGAPIAVTAYEDLTPPPLPQMLARPPRRDPGSGRPTKKERRELDRLLDRH
nr:RNA-binding S4 domain-containing protein [Devriesea agamarum]